MADSKEKVITCQEEWTPGALMTPDFWINTWKKGEAASQFHLAHVCGMLTKHIDTMLAGRKQIKVLFPFCGKDVSMKWLADSGHTVVGIECAEQACIEFFQESKLECTTETTDKFKIFKNKEGTVKLYCGDLYDFSPELESGFGAIWDRGGMNAVNAVERTKYASLMVSVMSPDCVYFLINFDSDDAKVVEEWECLTDEQLMQLFGDACDVELRVEYVDAALYNEGLCMDDMGGIMEKLSIIRPKK